MMFCSAVVAVVWSSCSCAHF